jgi:CBS domain-containing protein
MPVTLRARDIMDKNLLLLDGRVPVAEAVRRMVDGNVWSLIVEVRGLPEGVVTDRDVLRRCIYKGLHIDKVRLEEIMTTPLITINPDANIAEIMEKMVEKSIRRVFVVENGKVIGRVTQTKVFEESLNVMETLSQMRYHM